MPNKLSDYQLGTMLKKITGNKEFVPEHTLNEDELVEVLFSCDNFKSSFLMSDVHVIRDRVPIYVEFSKGNKSSFIDSLKEHMDIVAIVSDSIRSGRDGLFFVLPTMDEYTVYEWLRLLSSKNMHCCDIGGTYYLMSPVHSFIN